MGKTKMDEYYQGEKFVYILIDKSANSNLHLILVDYDSRYVPVEENMFRFSITVLNRFSNEMESQSSGDLFDTSRNLFANEEEEQASQLASVLRQKLESDFVRVIVALNGKQARLLSRAFGDDEVVVMPEMKDT